MWTCNTDLVDQLQINFEATEAALSPRKQAFLWKQFNNLNILFPGETIDWSGRLQFFSVSGSWLKCTLSKTALHLELMM